MIQNERGVIIDETEAIFGGPQKKVQAKEKVKNKKSTKNSKKNNLKKSRK